MIERLAFGALPRKHHIAFTGPDGALRWEECITQDGFDGPYTIAYHTHRPHEQRLATTTHGWAQPVAAAEQPLAKRHYLTGSLGSSGAPIDARIPILFNADVTISVSGPSADDPVYFIDADADTLVYVHEGKGILRTMLGDVRFETDDYVYVPRGLLHRFMPEGPQRWLVIECHGGMHIPRQWRNGAGQLRMDAPYCHRDFRNPDFVGPVDESIREIVVRRGRRFHGFSVDRSPLDVVGWDGTIYPWAFPIMNFQARAGLVHLPPTWHGTFAARGALICSFVPRALDFHPEAVPCPYPHSSVDVDEFMYYARGNFTSRRGVGPASVSFHPAGIPHGPHPGAYEGSRGHRETTELAVMLDCALPLVPTAAALGVEDHGYQDSFIDPR